MSEQIRVLVVDDDALVRAAVSMVLAGADDIAIVAEAADGSDVARAVAEHEPDVVLMDIRMPGMDGLAATELLRSQDGAPEVIVLTTFEADDYVLRALRAGAGGFLLKDTPPTEILRAVRAVAAGEPMLSPAITRRLIGDYLSRPGGAGLSATLDTLTNREREVVALAARGLSNDEIAGRMVISPATAKTHISRAMTKLHARDRAQLVVFAYESGLVSLRGGPAAD